VAWSPSGQGPGSARVGDAVRQAGGQEAGGKQSSASLSCHDGVSVPAGPEDGEFDLVNAKRPIFFQSSRGTTPYPLKEDYTAMKKNKCQLPPRKAQDGVKKSKSQKECVDFASRVERHLTLLKPVQMSPP
jgi:hypothetical protein